MVVTLLGFVAVSTTKFIKPDSHNITLVAGSSQQEPAPVEDQTDPQVEEKPQPPKLVTRQVPQLKPKPIPKISKIMETESKPKTTAKPPNGRKGGSIATGGDSLWDVLVQERIKANWNQPSRAVVGRNVPIVEFEIAIDKKGNIISIKKTRSSEIPALDQSAREALEKSNPLPPLPKYFETDHKTVPIIFRIPDDF